MRASLPLRGSLHQLLIATLPYIDNRGLNGSNQIAPRVRCNRPVDANLLRSDLRVRIRVLADGQFRRLQRPAHGRVPLHAAPRRYHSPKLGFGLLTVYLKEYNITGLILNFMMLAFTIQWYFLLKKFWYCVKLTDTANLSSLGGNLQNIRLASVLKYSYPSSPAVPSDIRNMQYFTLSQAICCAISMFVILFPMVGRVGPAEAVVIAFFGNAGYTLNEAVFWRFNISDNGYGMKIFLFGALAGIVASLLLKRDLTVGNAQYTSSYENQSLALVGAIFVWVLLPWLSVVDQNQADSASYVYDFRQVAPLNIIFALSSSAAASFSTSIWLRGKIAVHDIIFSCFSVRIPLVRAQSRTVQVRTSSRTPGRPC